MVRMKVELNAKQTIEAFAEQSCTHQQHHGYGQFKDDEVRTHTPPERACRAPAALRQPITHLRQRQTQSRGHGEDDKSQQRNTSGKEQDMGIQTKAGEIRHSGLYGCRKEGHKHAHDFCRNPTPSSVPKATSTMASMRN